MSHGVQVHLVPLGLLEQVVDGRAPIPTAGDSGGHVVGDEVSARTRAARRIASTWMSARGSKVETRQEAAPLGDRVMIGILHEP